MEADRKLGRYDVSTVSRVATAGGLPNSAKAPPIKERPRRYLPPPYAYLVVIVLIPIVLLVPSAPVFLPPLMPLTPAMLPRFMQFTTLVICLSAVASVSSNCLVEFMVCVSDSALTFVEVFCLKSRHYGGG
jgi:hypothetical protein